MLAETERLAALLHEPGPGARVQLAVAPCSPVLGHRAADGGVGRARPPARAPAPHPPRGDARGGGVLHRALRLPAGRVPRPARLARRRRLVRPLRPPLRGRHRPVRGDRHRRRPLPHLEPPARGRCRAGAGHARRRHPRRPRRRRLGVERARRPLPRGEAGAARRPRSRRRHRDDGARRDPARHPRRRRGAPARRHRLARARQVRRLRGLAHRRPRARAAPTIAWPASSSPARTASTGSSSAAKRSSATARSSTPTRPRSRRRIAFKRERSRR